MRWRTRDLFQWHKAFAWLPIYIGDQTVWLERYERRATFEHLYGYLYEFRKVRRPATPNPHATDIPKAPDA